MMTTLLRRGVLGRGSTRLHGERRHFGVTNQQTGVAVEECAGIGQVVAAKEHFTGILMLTILNVSTGAKEKGVTAGIAIGGVIALEAMFAGPICGASMNPVRSLAPALVSGHLEHLWVYLAAPVIGACFAVPLCIGVREEGCCSFCCSKSSPPTP